MNETPIYDTTKSINSFINDAELYLLNLQQSKYKLILQFVNEWLNKKFKSLTEFKYISKQILLKNKIHNNNMLKKYVPLFNTTFEIELNVNNETDITTIHEKYIINLLIHMLKFIKYKLMETTKNNKKYYTIKLIS